MIRSGVGPALSNPCGVRTAGRPALGYRPGQAACRPGLGDARRVRLICPGALDHERKGSRGHLLGLGRIADPIQSVG